MILVGHASFPKYHDGLPGERIQTVRYLRALTGIQANPGGTRDFTIKLRDQLSFLLLAVFLVILLAGCSSVTSAVGGTAPNITNVAPNPAAVGTAVTIEQVTG
jgi:hypothetical protein